MPFDPTATVADTMTAFEARVTTAEGIVTAKNTTITTLTQQLGAANATIADLRAQLAGTTPTSPVSLAALALSTTALASGTAVTIAITGATDGSTITGTPPDGMTLDSAAREISGTPTTAGDYGLVLTETLAGAVNSPRQTTIDVTVAAAPVVTPTPTFAKAADYAFGPSYLVNYDAADAYQNGNTGIDTMDGFLDLQMLIEPHVLAGPIYSKWAAANNGSGNSSFFFSFGTGGALFLAWFPAGGSFQSAIASDTPASITPMKTVWVRSVINATAAAVNGFAAGTVTFFTASFDGTTNIPTTWAQVGAVQAAPTTGIASCSTGQTVGTIGDGNVFNGKFFKASVTRGSGAIVGNPDFTGMTVAQTGTFTDTAATPSTWTINGPIAKKTSIKVAPTYSRMTRAATFKIKSLELLPKPPAAGSWGAAWANYDHTDFATRIAYAKSLGANTIKIACGGPGLPDYPAAAQNEANIIDFAATSRANGEKIRLNMASATDWLGTNGANRLSGTALIASQLALWYKYAADLLVGCDLINEINFARPSTWPLSNVAINIPMINDLAYLMSECRKAVPDLPLTFSVYINNRTDFAANALIAAQSFLDCEYHDVHTYNGKNNNSGLMASDAPAAADMAQLEGLPFFLGRHGVGECGILNSNTDAATTAWIQGVAAQGMLPKSVGADLFGDIDYTSGAENGNYGITGHPAMVAAFTAWPATAIQ